MYNDPRRSAGNFLRNSGIPVTLTLIGLNILTWLLNTLIGGGSPARYLTFYSDGWQMPFPWSLVTWPVVAGGHPLFVLLSLWWTFMIAGSLERGWGTRTFLGFFFGVSVLTALSTYLGGALLGRPVVLAGLWQAMAAPTVAWCLINTRERIGIAFGLVQIPAIWLAWLVALILWYEVGVPFLGLFALSGCVAAWWYVTQGRFTLSGLWQTPARSDRKRPLPGDRESAPRPGGFNPLRWWKERQERKRLEDIFRRSGFTEDER